MSRQRLLREMTAQELLEWQVLERLDPYGQLREDYRTAQVCAVLANVNRGKTTPPYRVEDFLLDFTPPEAPPAAETVEGMLAVLVAMSENPQDAPADYTPPAG
jgi:hypothetical protein